MKFLCNNDWRSAASFVCFGLSIKQNRVCVFYLVVKGFFSIFFPRFLIPVVGGMLMESPISAVAERVQPLLFYFVVVYITDYIYVMCMFTVFHLPERVGDARPWDRKIPVTKTSILF